MKQLLAFIQKEFLHVFRDKRTLLILFGLPVVQIVLFGFALNNEVKNIGISIFDNARDEHSLAIINRLRASDHFRLAAPVLDYAAIETAFKKGTIKCALVFPANFSRDLGHRGQAQVQVIADASDPNTATTVVNYISAIVRGYQQELNPSAGPAYQVVPQVRMLYNEKQNGSLNFIPGVIALIFMIVCTALTSVAVVREKESGTLEVLLVSPLRPIMVLLAKAVPYLVLSILNLVIILLLSTYLLDVPVRGSITLLFAESVLFIITCLSLGLLISNLTRTQQTAMLVSMMGMMLPTIIFTGFMFPIENMPKVFQAIAHIIPSRYYYIIIKAVMLKGLPFGYVWKETLVLAAMTLLLLAIALKNFKTRLQ